MSDERRCGNCIHSMGGGLTCFKSGFAAVIADNKWQETTPDATCDDWAPEPTEAEMQAAIGDVIAHILGQEAPR